LEAPRRTDSDENASSSPMRQLGVNWLCVFESVDACFDQASSIETTLDAARLEHAPRQ
jgi:hypothetical protein